MAKAVITLEDLEPGKFDVTIEYGEEFNETSDAHQYGRLLNQQLSKWLETVGPERIYGDAPSSRVPE